MTLCWDNKGITREALELWEDNCSCSQGVIIIDYRIHFQTICCQIQALVAPFSLVAPMCVLCIFIFSTFQRKQQLAQMDDAGTKK